MHRKCLLRIGRAGRRLGPELQGRAQSRTSSVSLRAKEHQLHVLVRDNNVDQALRVIKKKMQRVYFVK
jgi:hypothetical protein